MKVKTIVSIIVLVTFVLLGLFICRPIIHVVDKFLVDNTKEITKIDNEIDLSSYRNQPQKYFELIKEKQEGINELYFKFFHGDEKATFDEYYFKNNLHKHVSHFEKMNSGHFTEIINIKRGFNVYSYMNVSGLPGYKMVVHEFQNKQDMYPFVLAKIVPKQDFDNYKFIKMSSHKGRACALWSGKNYNKQTKKYFYNDYCYDEELGIALYHKYENNSKNKNTFFSIEKVKTDGIGFEEFYLPKYANKIINIQIFKFLTN